MIRAITELVTGRLDNHTPRPGGIPGAVTLVAQDGDVVHHRASGDAVRWADAAGTPVAHPVPMLRDTIFDVASLTKLVTAVVALQAIDEGFLGLDTLVSDVVPGAEPDVTLRHLLLHTSGLPAVRQLWTVPGGRAARAAALLATEPEAGAGVRHVYSCVGYLSTGLVLEWVFGSPLPTLVRENVTGPLDMADTGFHPAPEVLDRVAATEDATHVDRGIVRGEVHDEASWSLGGDGGNAGLFSTAADLLRFAEMLRAGGTDRATGAQVLSEESVALMTTNQLSTAMTTEVGYGQGIGPRIADRSFMGSLTSDRAFGHTGFTGTSLVVDPAHDLVVIVLANSVHPVRGRTAMGELRSAIADAAVEEVSKRSAQRSAGTTVVSKSSTAARSWAANGK